MTFIVAVIFLWRGCWHLDPHARAQLWLFLPPGRRHKKTYSEESESTPRERLRASPQRLPRPEEITCYGWGDLGAGNSRINSSARADNITGEITIKSEAGLCPRKLTTNVQEAWVVEARSRGGEVRAPRDERVSPRRNRCCQVSPRGPVHPGNRAQRGRV